MALRPDKPQKPKRFYKAVTVEAAEEGSGWAVLLDGRPVRTPAKRLLAAPSRALAELVADEWAAQGEEIDAHAMHAARLVNVGLDRVAEAREGVADQVRAYAETDLVGFIAEAPEALAARQHEAFAPLRAWAAEALGVALAPSQGIIAAPQPPESLQAARAHALALSDCALAALAHAAALMSSAVLAFALQRGRLGPAEAFAASRIDESFQEERWGVDAEAAARAAAIARELEAAHAVMRAAEDA